MNESKNETLYEILGVPTNASYKTIRNSYIAQGYVTSADPTEEEIKRQRSLCIAYETLSHPTKRKEHDAFLVESGRVDPSTPFFTDAAASKKQLLRVMRVSAEEPLERTWLKKYRLKERFSDHGVIVNLLVVSVPYLALIIANQAKFVEVRITPALVIFAVGIGLILLAHFRWNKQQVRIVKSGTYLMSVSLLMALINSLIENVASLAATTGALLVIFVGFTFPEIRTVYTDKSVYFADAFLPGKREDSFPKEVSLVVKQWGSPYAYMPRSVEKEIFLSKIVSAFTSEALQVKGMRVFHNVKISDNSVARLVLACGPEVIFLKDETSVNVIQGDALPYENVRDELQRELNENMPELVKSGYSLSVYPLWAAGVEEYEATDRGDSVDLFSYLEVNTKLIRKHVQELKLQSPYVDGTLIKYLASRCVKEDSDATTP